jgi:hypothetical protein
MRLNTSKCKVMHFEKSRNPPVIKLGNSILESVPTYKYLGFLINSKSTLQPSVKTHRAAYQQKHRSA